MKQYTQIKAKDRNPLIKGWYHTDQGELYWFAQETIWSCRNDRISEEYPEFWYEAVLSTPLKQLSEITDEDCIEVREKFYSSVSPMLSVSEIRGEILFKLKKSYKGLFAKEIIQHLKSKGYDVDPVAKPKQLSDEEIKEFCKKMKKLYTSNFKHCEHTDNNALLLTKDLIAIALSGSPLKEEKTSDNIGYVEGVYGYKTSIHNSNLSPQSDHINPIELLEWIGKIGFVQVSSGDWVNINAIFYEREFLSTSQLIETFKNRK